MFFLIYLLFLIYFSWFFLNDWIINYELIQDFYKYHFKNASWSIQQRKIHEISRKNLKDFHNKKWRTARSCNMYLIGNLKLKLHMFQTHCQKAPSWFVFSIGWVSKRVFSYQNYLKRIIVVKVLKQNQKSSELLF